MSCVESRSPLVRQLCEGPSEPNRADQAEREGQRGPRAAPSNSEGALIAVVGADGAGKSTAIDALIGWFSPDFRVAKIHMGKPRWSASTYLVKAILKLARVTGLLEDWAYRADVSSPEVRVDTGWLIWQVVTARDRYRAVRRARRLAARGTLVFCDRFPLSVVGSMDGLRARRQPSAAQRWPARMLNRLEERYYAAIGAPDLLAVLSVEPDRAVQRCPGDPARRVRQRAREILEVDWSATGARVFDANRPMTELHRELRSWLGSRL
jgi:thymidylate kinase